MIKIIENVKSEMQNEGANFASQNPLANRLRRFATRHNFPFWTFHFTCRASRGFTLIETLVAISLLTIAIVAPMSLTMQSLSSAYYARDQVTAFFLAQEAIEGVRAVRDANILLTALGTPTDLLTHIPSTTGQAFTIDMSQFTSEGIPYMSEPCSGACPPLQTNPAPGPGEDAFFGYRAGWEDTIFTRTIVAEYVDSNPDELQVSATVSWTTGGFQTRSFTLTENLYRWILDTEGGTTITEGGGGGGGPSLSAPAYATVPGGVNVSFTNSDPDDEDWIAFSPAGSGCAGAVAAQYLYVLVEEGTEEGSFEFDLDDDIEPGSYQFYLCDNGGYVADTQSGVVTIEGGGGDRN